MSRPVLVVVLLVAGLVALSSAKVAKEMEIIGPCVNSFCPESYACTNDKCMREKPRARHGATAIGPCVNDQCPAAHLCVRTDYQCYPVA